MVPKIISSGSKGNCIVYRNVMVDCGVPFSSIKEIIGSVDLLILTHEHKDHINITTIKKFQYERPTLRIACGEWMLPKLDGLNNIDIIDIGKVYNYGPFKISPIKAYHDVPNIGVRLFFNDCKIFHVTDTAHLKGVTAKDYEIYSVEHNYDEERAEEAIRISEKTGEYCHALGSINSHLSYKQAFEFIEENKKESSTTIRLHKSTKYS